MSELNQEYLAQILNEEYKIWKKEVPFMYNVLNSYELTTNSNTVSWLSGIEKSEDGLSSEARCLIGTNAIDKNCLLVMKVVLPTADTICDMTEYKTEAQVGQLGLKKLQVDGIIAQNAEILRARVNPFRSSIVVSKTGGYDPQINIYDLSEASTSRSHVAQLYEPLVKLEGHTVQGFGLDWNRKKESMIISGSLDRKICIWDIEGTKQTQTRLKPMNQYHFHSTGVEDVNWNKINPDIFASCGQDRLIAIWDMRERKKKPECQKTGHTGQIYSIDFNPHCEHLLLSAGDDYEIGLWDLRNISKRLHTFVGHTDSINKLAWNPEKRLIFVSVSSDRKSIVWDVQKCGDVSQNEELGEMVFIHGGHRSRVLDVDWNTEGDMLASTEEGGTLQTWRPSHPLTSL